MPKLSWPVLPAWLRWSAAPAEATPLQRRNFINVQIDGIGVGLASAAAPFLPVFLVRLGATNFQVGLLTTMPAVTGLLLAVAVGRFLQRQRMPCSCVAYGLPAGLRLVPRAGGATRPAPSGRTGQTGSTSAYGAGTGTCASPLQGGRRDRRAPIDRRGARIQADRAADGTMASWRG